MNCSRIIRNLNTLRIAKHLCSLQPQQSQLHSTAICFKVKKHDKGKKNAQSLNATAIVGDNLYVKNALSDMTDMLNILGEELAKHFSLQVDLRLYEDIVVKMEKGDEHKMSHLGRVSLKSPQMVMINFANNPNAIKWAKLAIQKSTLNVNPQHEGVVLYIPTPRMTRERREQLAQDAKGKIYNEYKQALNTVYTKYDKQCAQQSLKQDEIKDTRQKLLSLKRGMEEKGLEIIETKRKELLKEVA